MSEKRQPTPEETRDRILGQITRIIEESEKRDAFQPHEVHVPRLRSALYAMMIEEFAECAHFHENVTARVRGALGLPLLATPNDIVKAVEHLKRHS